MITGGSTVLENVESAVYVRCQRESVGPVVGPVWITRVMLQAGLLDWTSFSMCAIQGWAVVIHYTWLSKISKGNALNVVFKNSAVNLITTVRK